MNTTVKNIELERKIFEVADTDFVALARDVFGFQYLNNPVYRQYCDLLLIDPAGIHSLEQIPFLPVQFFKSHHVTTTTFEPQAIFESSGTTGTVSSRHYVRDISLYEKSFSRTFRQFYGDPAGWCIIALLPSYVERGNSSLVMMADRLVKQSGHPASGFYLDEQGNLERVLRQAENDHQKTMLLGVTFALLDFAAKCPMPLLYTTVMETGGMKGRREEMTRAEVHEILCNSFGLPHIHSEYGMTELLSQAYSSGSGRFYCPGWMKVLVREEDDPFAVRTSQTIESGRFASGAVNIIDLANLYSCSFIATEDAAKLYADGGFEILGRLDHTDIRGCSLLTL